MERGGLGMRYMRLKWIDGRPSEAEIAAHLKLILGKTDFLSSGFRIVEGILACENAWLDKVRGALALKWQFQVERVSATKKSVSKQGTNAPHCQK